MKYKGRKIEGVPKEIEPILRKEGDIIFVLTAVVDYSEFDELCPIPIPPRIRNNKGDMVPDLEDAGYKSELERYAKKHTAWSVINSMRETEGLEWEQVKRGDPETWHLWEKELQDSGLTTSEVRRLWATFLRVNSLDDRMLEAARTSFLAGQGAK